MNRQKIYFLLLCFVAILIQNSVGIGDNCTFKRLFSWFTGGQNEQQQREQQSMGKESQIATKSELISQIYELLKAQALMVEDGMEQNEKGEKEEKEVMWWGDEKRADQWETQMGQLVAKMPEGLEQKLQLEKMVKNSRKNANFEFEKEIDELKTMAEQLSQLTTKFKFPSDGQITNKVILFEVIDHYGDWDFEKRFLFKYLANTKGFYYSKSVASFFGEITASEMTLNKILKLIETARTELNSFAKIVGQKAEECLIEIKEKIENIKKKVNAVERNISEKLNMKVEKEKMVDLLTKSSLGNDMARNLAEKLAEIKEIANLEGEQVEEAMIIMAFVISQVDDAKIELTTTCQIVEKFSKKRQNEFKRAKNMMEATNVIKKLHKILLQTKTD